MPVPTPRAPTILLVDDADVVRKSAARCLRRRGYIVLEAGSADDALALLHENGDNVDVILTDLVLPVMHGAELVKQARRSFPGLAIAYMTGHVGVSARCETPLEHDAPLLLKPFTPALLEESVRAALSLAARRGGTPPFNMPPH
jgi:CheY-like chemotaxis protein